jgi:hypothetical protein
MHASFLARVPRASVTEDGYVDVSLVEYAHTINDRFRFFDLSTGSILQLPIVPIANAALADDLCTSYTDADPAHVYLVQDCRFQLIETKPMHQVIYTPTEGVATRDVHADRRSVPR